MKSIVFVGVGGQGTLLASRIIGRLLLQEGFDVKVSEVHGMSQRGGSVVTYVRFGDKVHSPIVFEGGADIVVAFEQLEGYRSIGYLKDGGLLISNTQEIDPMPVITGAMQYPSDIFGKIKDMGIAVSCIDALALACEAGNPKAVNVVLLGVLARYMDFTKQMWLDAVKATVPPKFLEINTKAFELGYQTNCI